MNLEVRYSISFPICHTSIVRQIGKLIITINQIFLSGGKDQMVFSSTSFLFLFLPITLGIYYLISKCFKR